MRVGVQGLGLGYEIRKGFCRASATKLPEIGAIYGL